MLRRIKINSNKKYFISILGLILILVLSVQSVYASEYTIKVGEIEPTDSVMYEAEVIFKDIIELGSKGEIKVEIYPSEQLGNQGEITDSIKVGAVEAGWCWYKSVNSKFSIFQMPFLFASVQQARNFIKDSSLIEKYKEEAKQNGYYVLGFLVEPPRNITNNVRPIEKPDDLKGLLIRVPPMDVMRKSMQYLGASPQSMGLGDLYMALKQGVVDGQENPSLRVFDFKFYEVQKYLSLVKYSLFPGVFCINLDFFESLPYKYQKLVELAGQVLNDYSQEFKVLAVKECESFLREKMIINEITPENHKLFVEKLQPMWQEYVDDGYFSQEDLDQVRAYVEKN